ncbi:hypothetical protein [Tenacibaculum finnmarkense]|uniref:hypothetical protein n=1 Tax=Tenacibaculum finnmarkense TaxID=2781243 RepID=UPI001EFAC736|nr:hypothetical protein [Tenacibaculum finnmarkense]MCG8802866.1 hypothetical protein [Tenacibaculum finnmarkense]MCG8825594.1 hypothetical protein [Tenacibaculum finnmarkense]
MEENILMWIQNEKNEQFDYMFYGDELLKETDLPKIKIIKDVFFNNPNSKTIWKEKNYSQSSVLKFNEKYVLTGVLKTTDSNGRHLAFMFYLDSIDSNSKSVIYRNLNKIGKEIDADLFNKLLSKAKPNNKKIIYSSLLLAFIMILYKIFKKS